MNMKMNNSRLSIYHKNHNLLANVKQHVTGRSNLLWWLAGALVAGIIIGNSGIASSGVQIVSIVAGLYIYIILFQLALMFTNHMHNQAGRLVYDVTYPIEHVVDKFNRTGSAWFAPLVSLVVLFVLNALI